MQKKVHCRLMEKDDWYLSLVICQIVECILRKVIPYLEYANRPAITRLGTDSEDDVFIMDSPYMLYRGWLCVLSQMNIVVAMHEVKLHQTRPWDGWKDGGVDWVLYFAIDDNLDRKSCRWMKDSSSENHCHWNFCSWRNNLRLRSYYRVLREAS